MAGILRFLAPVLAGLMIAPFMAQDASAQNRELLNRLDRLQRELVTLQSHVYRGGKAARQSGGAPTGLTAPGGGDPRMAARLQVRIDQLERELRSVTGRIEEIQHATRQLNKRLSKLVSDVDYRLSALERASRNGQPPGQGTAPQAAVAPKAAGAGRPPAPTRARPPQTLGFVPKSALARRPGQVKPAAAARPQKAALPAKPVTPAQQYETAIALLQSEKFSAAERAFRNFIKSNPKHQLRANAHYWLGETYYARKDYQRAAFTFADSFQKFPDSGKAADNLLKLGMSLGRLDKKKEACTTFSRLLENFPKASGTLKRRVARQRRSNNCG